MWIVAGPNGAGKSTFTEEFLRENILPPDLLKLNADDVTAGYRKTDQTTPQDELNLRAARVVDQKVTDLILAGTSFLVETVLSSGKYRASVSLAQQREFQLNLVYVSVFPPELSPKRVTERVQKGGHAVAWDKAIERYHRSHQELLWFAGQANRVLIFDNSPEGGLPDLIFFNDRELDVSDHRDVRFHKSGVNSVVDAAVNEAFYRPGLI
jgi:predicted ABC-type ATPase